MKGRCEVAVDVSVHGLEQEVWGLKLVAWIRILRSPADRHILG